MKKKDKYPYTLLSDRDIKEVGIKTINVLWDSNVPLIALINIGLKAIKN